MRRLAALLLLLSACGSQDSTDTADDAAAPDPAAEALAAANLAAGGAAEDPARLQARVERAMAVILRDPRSARYANVRAGAGGSICGEVDSKQENGRFGGMRPFVVSPEGVAVVSTTPAIAFGDPDDLFPDHYIRWCASPAELRTLGPGLPAGPADPGVQADLPDDPSLDPDEPPAPAPGQAARPGAVPRPPADRNADKDDSFFNAVAR